MKTNFWVARALMPMAILVAGEARAQALHDQSPLATAQPAEIDAPPAAGMVRLAAETPVQIEIGAEISSRTGKIDDWFPIRLAAPIEVDGKVLIPAGATGQGQIVHAAKARALGKPGELILAARFIACGDARIELRSFRVSNGGKDNSGLIVAGSIAAGVFAAPLMFVSGGEVIVPNGATGTAKVKTTIDVPATIATSCAQRASIQ